MEKCKFADLSEANQSIVKKELERHAKDVDYDKVDVFPQDDNKTLIIEYGNVKIAVPIGKPDQQTSNNIWQTLTTGVLIIAGVGIALVCSKKKNW